MGAENLPKKGAEAGREASDAAKKAARENPDRKAESPLDKKQDDVRRKSAESLDKLRAEQAEKRLQESDSKESKDTVDTVIDTVEKGSQKLMPVIEKMFDVYERITNAMRSAIAPYIPKLQKLGLEIPEWLMVSVPGTAVVMGVLQKSGRTLINNEKTDGKSMRMLQQQFKKVEKLHKAKNNTYTFEQYIEDLSTDMPADNEDVTLEELATHGQKTLDKRQKEASDKPAGAPEKKGEQIALKQNGNTVEVKRGDKTINVKKNDDGTVSANGKNWKLKSGMLSISIKNIQINNGALEIIATHPMTGADKTKPLSGDELAGLFDKIQNNQSAEFNIEGSTVTFSPA